MVVVQSDLTGSTLLMLVHILLRCLLPVALPILLQGRAGGVFFRLNPGDVELEGAAFKAWSDVRCVFG